MNHTSDQHDWFTKSIKGIKPYSKYYVWKDHPIESFSSQFENESWTFVPERNQYYLHKFSKHQPDINWENPKLIREFINIIKFWMNNAVTGFRFDVVDMIGKKIDEGKKLVFYRVKLILDKIGYKTFKKEAIFTVGECWSVGRNTSAKWTNKINPTLTSIFNARYMFLNENKSRWGQKPINKEIFLEYKNWIIEQYQILENSIIPIFIENHDFPRSISRLWEDDKNLIEKTKLLAVTHYLLKVVPFIYQGQELGLPNANYSSFDNINDIETKKFIKNNKNKLSRKKLLKCVNFGTRDNPRKPIPWDNKISNKIIPFYNFGNSFFVTHNLLNRDSTFNFYKNILKFRNDNKNLFINGIIKFFNIDDYSLFSYEIVGKNETIRIITNWFDNRFIN